MTTRGGNESLFDGIARRVERAIVRYQMLPLSPGGAVSRDSRVLVAISGGADSTFLAVVLHGILTRRREAGGLGLAHVNLKSHASDDATEAHVRARARAWGVPVFVGMATEAGLSAGPKRGSPLMRMRREKYRVLSEIARLEGYSAIATAHHRDDQAETVLLRAATGSWLGGLAGIPAVGPIQGLEGGLAIRPLLGVGREEMREALRELDEPWLEDPLNEEMDGPRMILRREVLPLLEKINVAASRHVADLAAQAAEYGEDVAAEAGLVTAAATVVRGERGPDDGEGGVRSVVLPVVSRGAGFEFVRAAGDAGEARRVSRAAVLDAVRWALVELGVPKRDASFALFEAVIEPDPRGRAGAPVWGDIVATKAAGGIRMERRGA